MHGKRYHHLHPKLSLREVEVFGVVGGHQLDFETGVKHVAANQVVGNLHGEMVLVGELGHVVGEPGDVETPLVKGTVVEVIFSLEQLRRHRHTQVDQAQHQRPRFKAKQPHKVHQLRLLVLESVVGQRRLRLGPRHRHLVQEQLGAAHQQRLQVGHRLDHFVEPVQHLLNEGDVQGLDGELLQELIGLELEDVGLEHLGGFPG